MIAGVSIHAKRLIQINSTRLLGYDAEVFYIANWLVPGTDVLQ